MELVGRKQEQNIFENIYTSGKAEFIAVYGRRRVGKTFLIEKMLSKHSELIFSVTGKKDGSLKDQLNTFYKALQKTFYKDLPPPTISNWDNAFETLCAAIEAYKKNYPKKSVSIFLDELPWLTTKRSRLIQAIDHYWNTRLVKLENVKLIVCGSAASWMLENLVHAKGGLYNRLTRTMRIEPFTLSETKDFFASRRIKFNLEQILEVYMALGGIPHYLDKVQLGTSPKQMISILCFQKNGELAEEFGRLFSSLFENSEQYIKIVKVIAACRYGVSISEIAKELKLKIGGRFVKRLQELEEAGFIAGFTPYKYKSKETFYRVIDEFCLFHLKWIEGAPKKLLASGAEGYWEGKSSSPSYYSWAGYSFESLCLKHISKIKSALGLTHIPCETGAWKYSSKKHRNDDHGAQIDLLFDRNDGMVTLCEIKYSRDLFAVDKKFADVLKSKIKIFEEKLKLKKTISFALVTIKGLKRTAWSEGLIDQIVTLDRLF